MKTLAQFVQQGIGSLAELQEALQLAVQLEFSTLPPYLCAEWSIDTANDPDGVASTIGGIAMQEMFHFALAGNMLAAIGGRPEIASATFIPTYPTNVLPGGIAQKLAVDLKPLSADQLRVFMQIELPEFPPVAFALRARPATIGAFYDTVAAGFETVDPAILPNAPHVVFDEVFPITSVADAKAAVALIKAEGEGTEGSPDQPPAGNDVIAHYYAFKEILTGRKLVKNDGVWSFTGTPIRFPSVFEFSPAVGNPGASTAFNRALSQLLIDLQTCWTSGAAPNIDDMFTLQDLGQTLIQQGIRPEFLWSDP